jgi:hypothetical protein
MKSSSKVKKIAHSSDGFLHVFNTAKVAYFSHIPNKKIEIGVNLSLTHSLRLPLQLLLQLLQLNTLFTLG